MPKTNPQVNIQPVIIAGGSGSRLWPVSRKMYPKQFLPLTSIQEPFTTLLEQTLARLDSLNTSPPLLVCNEEHRFIAAEQMRQTETPHSGLILEPLGRNTAPAICLAALRAQELNENSILLVLPADHHIANNENFITTINSAASQIQAGQMVTFGITPSRPATGYGYIRTDNSSLTTLSHVLEFVEKPNKTKAEEYIKSGHYYWNSGIFMFHTNDFLTELEMHNPAIKTACEKAWDGKSNDLEFIRIDETEFAKCPSDSIDYAVMEHTQNAMVMPLDAQWNDVGGWSALADVLPKDNEGNVTIGDVLCKQSSNNYIRSEDRLIAVLGIEDMIIVDTKDALLVTSKDQSEQVKLIVDTINDAKRDEAKYHRIVYRPWGHYDSIDSGERYQVKRISVKAGAKLSVQMHHHRAEHWVVVKGTAKVRVGDEEKLLGENESVYIPVGVTHSLENPGKIPLELIEVQSGAYLGEDDIVRFEDKYGRV